MIRIRFFGPGELNQNGFGARTVWRTCGKIMLVTEGELWPGAEQWNRKRRMENST